MRHTNDKIIHTNHKRVEVQASPGSGKSHNLIQRVQHLLNSNVPPEEILVLSFSKVSVSELKLRMKAMTTKTATSKPKPSKKAFAVTGLSKVTVQTTHGFALGLIKKQKILSDEGACNLLVKALKSVQKRCRKRVLWPDISTIAKRKRLDQIDQLLEPKNIRLILFFLTVVRASRKKISETAVNSQFSTLKHHIKILRAVRSEFTVLKGKQGVIDYGDMLHQAIKAIDEGVRVPYTHILVDEYQDCSAAQIYVLESLARLKGRSIMVFGDSNQAIYGFAGAKYTPLAEVLDGVQLRTLPVSFRLTSQTAALASAVAQQGKGKAIQTKRDGDLPVLVQDDSLAGQTKSIVQHILRLIDGGTPPAQIVVLARIKALLAPIERSLLGHNVQTSRIGTKRHNKHALRVLKLVRIVERCVGEKRKFKPKMLRKALPSLKLNDSLCQKGAQALKKASRIRSLEGRYRLCAKAYLQLMGGVRKDPELRADVNRWEPWSRDHDNARAMRNAISAMDPQAVVTGTIHSAKGGEWDHVLVVGVTDRLLPLYLSLDEHSLVEERNLLYVAITRARETVRLYHAPAYHARSRQRFKNVSRFLVKRAVRKTLRIV